MAKGTQVTRYDERFAKMAEEYAGGERASGEFLSTKGGILTFDGEPLPGNQMLVVILDVVRERTYYTLKYEQSAEINLPPVCYAFGRTEEEMAPHPSMQADETYFIPQNDICADCPNNEWGSADTGRGKACGERRRLALLPAGYYTPKKGSRSDFLAEIFTDNEHYESADIAYLKTPVTSVKDYARYVTQLNASLRLPPMAVITRVYLEPDAKTQFRVKFEMVEQLPDDVLDTILARHEEAKAGIIFGYAPPSAEARAAAGQKKRGIRR
jgi:hypothetical protein